VIFNGGLIRGIVREIMNNRDMREWLNLLGSSRKARISVIYDLLSHAAEDEMSDMDKAICVRALSYMGIEYVEL
jgi:hypothetical protein